MRKPDYARQKIVKVVEEKDGTKRYFEKLRGEAKGSSAKLVLVRAEFPDGRWEEWEAGLLQFCWYPDGKAFHWRYGENNSFKMYRLDLVDEHKDVLDIDA